jgi:hypothetical protein
MAALTSRIRNPAAGATGGTVRSTSVAARAGQKVIDIRP